MSIGDFTPPVEYRPIPDFPAYCVGSDGSVWSRWKRDGVRGSVLGRWRRLSTVETPYGYLTVTLRRQDGTFRRLFVHVLLLEVFIGPRPHGYEACHHDGDRKNNSLDNLRWDTSAANKADMERHGTLRKGDQIRSHKVSEDDVRIIRTMVADGYSQSVVARRFNIEQKTVSNIHLRKTWKHI